MKKTAYDKVYLYPAMKNLAVMMDCGVSKYHLPLTVFYDYFLKSNVSKHFAKGNPRYLVGYSGAELADLVIEQAGLPVSALNDGSYQVGQTYWSGWSLAYYQWLVNRDFEEINKHATIQKINDLYNPLHEADIEKFVEVVDSWNQS